MAEELFIDEEFDPSRSLPRPAEAVVIDMEASEADVICDDSIPNVIDIDKLDKSGQPAETMGKDDLTQAEGSSDEPDIIIIDDDHTRQRHRHNLRPQRFNRHLHALKQQAKRRKKNTNISSKNPAPIQRTMSRRSTLAANGGISIFKWSIYYAFMSLSLSLHFQFLE